MESGLEEIDEAELIRAFIDEALDYLHTAVPAQVTAYDNTKQTVDVVPQVNRQVPDGGGNFVSEQLPKLTDVPVCFPRCQQFGMTFPLANGDTGLVVFCHRNIGSWRATNSQGDAGDLGKHTLDGAVFVPGLFADALASTTASTTKMIVGSLPNAGGPARIEIDPFTGGNLGAGANGSSPSKGIARRDDTLTASAAMKQWALDIENLLAAASIGSPAHGAFAATAGATDALGTITKGSLSWFCVN